ncbi:hypothetical protein ABFS82_03G016500 [Erythranthe guttata]|uniref:IST1-like protein n=1 Tax=Erythranthe guttata TaxID=4155 RepID=A0A022RUZ7_ERYGU|nr:PREDICTED: vacuolar protein sorting-associated protein IST1 [Erythranthe guttata]EYU43558.1 hypothetical protein MIMGU_mgv1a005603mg [Erythranthe guttata]|eukprot:XP_012829820.1 PREDICTED: vacuolar protein sorting-associated protein IST1 [Erythranthe guttata]
MSVLDSIFKQRFNAAKCKTLLKLTIPRIKLLRNRREMQLRQMRREIAKLLETGQEATARIRVEHIIREEKMMAAQEIVELFCELVVVRLPIIEIQRECPLDLKEAISSICFAAPRCADLPELIQAQMLFAGKYSKEFVIAATELMPESGVNRQLIELLSIRAPAPDVKLKLLKEIALEHELEWDPTATESELLKPHEDLLNGPSQFVSGSNLDEPTFSTSERGGTHDEKDNNTAASDADYDIIDFQEIPKQPLLQQSTTNRGTASAPEMMHFPSSALSEIDDEEEEEEQEPKNFSHLEPEDNLQEKKPFHKEEEKQFVPFISSPSLHPVKEQNRHPAVLKTRNEDMDLQDVLAAAQAAADSAERAAASARAAASLTQLRISELVKKRNDDFDKQNSVSDCDGASTSPKHNGTHYDPPLAVEPSCPGNNNLLGQGVDNHQPPRSPPIDDESYFSYPNLFTSSQGSNLDNHAQSPTDSK